jgi:tRNA(Arg) A34 adenosine deaminase TadA
MTAQDFMRQAIAVAEANSRHPFGAITVDGDTNSVIAKRGKSIAPSSDVARRNRRH